MTRSPAGDGAGRDRWPMGDNAGVADDELARPILVGGYCDPAFERVRAEFAENLSSRGELGAALCVITHSEVVVDLWGGWADAGRTRPFGPDQLVNVFSVGKALTSLIAAQL